MSPITVVGNHFDDLRDFIHRALSSSNELPLSLTIISSPPIIDVIYCGINTRDSVGGGAILIAFTLSLYKPRYSISDAINEIKSKFEDGIIKEKEENYTVKWMKKIGLSENN